MSRYYNHATTLELYHFGVKGQKWGIRRYQNADGTLTDAGKNRLAKYQSREIESVNKKYNGTISKGMNSAAKYARKSDRQRVLASKSRDDAQVLSENGYKYGVATALESSKNHSNKALSYDYKSQKHLNKATAAYMKRNKEIEAISKMSYDDMRKEKLDSAVMGLVASFAMSPTTGSYITYKAVVSSRKSARRLGSDYTDIDKTAKSETKALKKATKKEIYNNNWEYNYMVGRTKRKPPKRDVKTETME